MLWVVRFKLPLCEALRGDDRAQANCSNSETCVLSLIFQLSFSGAGRWIIEKVLAGVRGEAPPHFTAYTAED